MSRPASRGRALRTASGVSHACFRVGQRFVTGMFGLSCIQLPSSFELRTRRAARLTVSTCLGESWKWCGSLPAVRRQEMSDWGSSIRTRPANGGIVAMISFARRSDGVTKPAITTASNDIFLQNRPVIAMNPLFVFKPFRGVVKMSAAVIHNDETIATDAMSSSIVRQCSRCQFESMN